MKKGNIIQILDYKKKDLIFNIIMFNKGFNDYGLRHRGEYRTHYKRNDSSEWRPDNGSIQTLANYLKTLSLI